MYSQYLLHYLLPVLSNLLYDKCVIIWSTCHDRLPSFDIIPWIYENIMREIERYNKGFIHSFFRTLVFFSVEKGLQLCIYTSVIFLSTFCSNNSKMKLDIHLSEHSVNNLLPGIIRRIAQSFYVFWINLEKKFFSCIFGSQEKLSSFFLYLFKSYSG